MPLRALIAESPAKAETFVHEISSVYRYLLPNNEQELASVREELGFIESYFHLLKTRYGDGIQLRLEGVTKFDTYQLPPHTLQVLVENAVKHNAILPDSPLMIAVSIENNQLAVQNNIQLKTAKVASNKVGLANIAPPNTVYWIGVLLPLTTITGTLPFVCRSLAPLEILFILNLIEVYRK